MTEEVSSEYSYYSEEEELNPPDRYSRFKKQRPLQVNQHFHWDQSRPPSQREQTLVSQLSKRRKHKHSKQYVEQQNNYHNNIEQSHQDKQIFFQSKEDIDKYRHELASHTAKRRIQVQGQLHTVLNYK